MDSCLFSPDFFRLEAAEQGVIRALEVAANTVEELAKGSEASQDALEVHCKTFLENVQAVQQALVALGAGNYSHRPYQGRPYSAQIEASLLQQQVLLAEEQLQSATKQQPANNQEVVETSQKPSG